MVLGLPDFGLLRRVLRGTDLLCTVSDALADALVDSLTAFGLAVDPLPFPSPEETAVRMAWRAALDQDPAEMWLRARIAEALAPRSAPSPPEMPQASSTMRATAVPDERDLR